MYRSAIVAAEQRVQSLTEQLAEAQDHLARVKGGSGLVPIENGVRDTWAVALLSGPFMVMTFVVIPCAVADELGQLIEYLRCVWS